MDPGDLPLFGKRYRAEELLSQGPGGQTWLGLDVQGDRQVVIKTLPVELLTADSRALARMSKPLGSFAQNRLASALAQGIQDELYYLVRPYVSGVTLTELFAQGPLSVQQGLTLALSLLNILQEAHAVGLVHHNLKPTNVILSQRDSLKQLSLVDFGLSRFSHLDHSIRELPLEAIRYQPPEQAGLIDHPLGHWSDLYAVGVLLYEALAGRPLLEAANASDLLAQLVVTQPSTLRSQGKVIPRVLDQLLQRLLFKDPQERYQSASAVMEDLSQLQEKLDGGDADPALVIGLSDKRRSLTNPSFIGRQQELNRLSFALDQARQGQGGVVLLEGESGVGKSRLLEELAQLAMTTPSWIIHGHAEVQAAHRPFQLFSGLVHALITRAEEEQEWAQTLAARLEEAKDVLCMALPRLASVLGSTPRNSNMVGLEEHVEVRGQRSLAALLDTLGSPDRPALLLMDDCQWADELTLKALAHWQRSGHGASDQGRYVLVVLSCRTEEVGPGHLLRSFGPLEHLELSPLPSVEIQQLVQSMAGVLPHEVLAVVEHLGQGHPFMAEAVIRGIVESGVLVGNGAGWKLDPQALSHIQSSRKAAAFLVHRLELLPSETLDLLSMGAVLGKTYRLEVLAALAGKSLAQVREILVVAEQRHLLWFQQRQERGTFIFVHDKLREICLQRLSARVLEKIHTQAAQYFQSREADNVFEIAFHLDAAGLSDQALPYALLAATQARNQQAPEVALQHYRIAYRGAKNADRAAHCEAAEGLGEMLMFKGAYDEASGLLREASTLAEGTKAQAEIAAKLGELAFKQGNIKGASEELVQGLRYLGRVIPRTVLVALLFLIWEILVQVMHSVFPKYYLAKKPLAEANEDLLAVRLFDRLSYAWWFSRGPVPTLWSHLRCINSVERYPATRELGQVYSGHGPAMTLVPHIGRAIHYVERSYQIRQAMGDVWGQGQSLYFWGVALLTGGQFHLAKEKLEQGIALLERTGDQWQINTARYHQALTLLYLGELRAALEISQQLHASGVAIGDAFAAGASLGIWAKASAGQVPADKIAIELERPASENMQRLAEVMQAGGIRLLAAGQGLKATEMLRACWKKVKQGRLRSTYITSIPLWLSLALRLQISRLPATAREERATLLKEAWAAVHAGQRLARWFCNDLPFALRERALLLAIAGKVSQARRLLNRSLRVALAQQARFEAAQTQLVRGQLGLGLGWPGAMDDMTQAQEELEAMGVRSLPWLVFPSRALDPLDSRPVTLSLAQRFDAVVDEGRSIATALTTEAIYKAVQHAVMSLLRSEQCLIIEHQEGQQVLFEQPGADTEETYDWGLVNQTLVSGQILRFSSVDEEQVEVAERLALAGVKSALVVPVKVREKNKCCLYITHKQVAGIFGEEEERLGAFLATLAGAALENAEGFARVEGLSRFLEQRVRERTAELEHAKGQLEDSVFQLQEANRARNDFFTNVSHELRTPLTLIMAPLDEIEQLADQRGETGLLIMAQFIRRNAQSLLRQVDDILDFARLDAGQMPMIPEELELVQFIEAVVISVQPLADRRSISLVFEKPLETIEIIADAKLLRRVILNLLVNGVKYINEGDSIFLSLQEENNQVVIEIQDTGPGIPLAFQSRVFERFQRLTDGAGRSVEGSGIGLAMVKEIVELHSGRIELESDEGHGALFRITLPRGDQHFLPGAAAVEQNHAVGGGDPTNDELHRMLSEASTILFPLPPDRGLDQARPTKGRVLLVEDNLEMKQFLTSILSREFKVLEAENGQQALEIARREVPEVIVSDVMMPLMDGYELCRLLKSDSQTHNIPLILVSARHGVEAALEGFSAGADDYITKPFSSPELLARVGAQLRIRTLGTALLRADKQASLGLMSAGIAHEVLNPTNVIVNGIPLLRQLVATLANDQRYMDKIQHLEGVLGAIEQSGDRIQKTVKAILTFARQRDDYLELQAMRLSEGIESILTILNYRLSKGCTVHRDLAWDEPFLCYPELLQQVIMNLIINALDALDQEGTVYVSSERLEDKIVIRIRDDGPGVSTQDRERIFAPYYTSKAQGKGTGLGLALSREIVTLHQGTLDLAPGSGRGAEFVITLPFLELTSEVWGFGERGEAALKRGN